MNRKRAKKLLPIIEHYANGGQIQERFRKENWLDYGGLTHFDDSEYDFRIKPEPREYWVYDAVPLIIEPDGPPGERAGAWIKVREVLE